MFIPLKKKFFQQFESGEKHEEFRLHGKRWNEKVCYIGRPVTLSNGYSGARIYGDITAFRIAQVREMPTIREIYPQLPDDAKIACIAILLTRP